MTTQPKTKRSLLKVKPLNTTEKTKAINHVLYESFNSKAEDISLVSRIAYKGSEYLIITKEQRKEIDVKKYQALRQLKQFLGSKGIKELTAWDSTLTPRHVKQGMTYALKTSSKQVRSLYRLNKNDINNIYRLRSEAGSFSDIIETVKYDWSNTEAGRKSENRKYTSQTNKRAKRLFGSVYSNMVGGVHTESGLYLKAYKEKLTKILDLNKKPMTQERHYGLEMEFLLPHDNKQAIKDAFMASPYKDMLTLTRDGSVTSNDKYDPAELKICTPHNKLEETVSFVTKILSLHSCVVDKSCGLHVHLDARNDNALNMFNKLIDQQSCLFDLVPSSRRNNQYCRSTKRTDFCKGSRYKSINSTAYSKFRTLEVRLHGGTIDPNKIINWVTLLSTIAYNPNAVTSSRSVPTMVKKLGLNASLTEYLLEREAKFSSHSRSED